MRVSLLLPGLCLALIGCTATIRSSIDPGTPVAPDSGTDAMADEPAIPPPDAGPDVGTPVTGGLLVAVDNLCAYVHLGDSQAAGFNATQTQDAPPDFHCQARPNDCANLGWARLLFRNATSLSPAHATYESRDLVTRFPGVHMYSQAHSGFTSETTLGALQDYLDQLPACDGPGQDVLVTLGAGGNDFNDELETIFIRAATEVQANELDTAYDEIFRILRARYDYPDQGRTLVVVATNVYEFTDGTGRIPAEYDEDFCAVLHNPSYNDEARRDALENLDYFNSRMRATIEGNGGVVSDHHAPFLCHGMNSTDRWFDVDCTHLNDTGHHNDRRLHWQILTGELLGEPLTCP